MGVILSTETKAEPNPLLNAMMAVAQADRIHMDGDETGVMVTFWRGDKKAQRFIADDDEAMDGSWEQIALDARDALAA